MTRKGMGLTQLELAVRLGVTPTTVYNWEAGRSLPKLNRLRKLAEIAGVKMDDISAERTVAVPRKRVAAAGEDEAGRLDAEDAHGMTAEDRAWLEASLSDLAALEPYDWGEEGLPPTKPVEYVPGVGFVIVGGRDETKA